ncbi:MAG: hypothetical protein WBD73_12090, partial [Candidatus Acidiferrales bacterium]
MPILDPAPVVLLGRLDLPTDGVRDYCSQLSAAFGRCGEHLDIVEMALGKPWLAESDSTALEGEQTAER